MTTAAATKRPPLIAPGDLWVVLAILVVLFFPFGLGGSSAPEVPATPKDATVHITASGTSIGVPPTWNAAEDVDRYGWSVPGSGGVARGTVQIWTLPTPIGAGQPLAVYSRIQVQGYVEEVDGEGFAIVEESELTMAGGQPGYRLKYTYTNAAGVPEVGVVYMATRGTTVSMARLLGTQDNIDAAVLRINEPYLRTLAPPAA